MKRKLLYALGAVVAVVVLAGIALPFFLGSIVKTGVNTLGPRITKTKVDLAAARISPLTGTGALTGLFVGNPEGWKSDKAFFLGKAHLELEPASLFGDHIIINEILIDEPEFVYETKIISSNIKDLLKNIKESTGGGKSAVETVKTKKGEPVKFEVRKFTLQNGKVTLGVGPAAVTVPMPPLALTDIGTKEGGVTANELTAVVMEHVLGNVLITAAEAVAKAGLSTGSATTNTTKDAIRNAGENLKKIFGGGK